MTDQNNANPPETHPLPWSALPADKADLFEGADMWFFNDANGEEVFYGCAMSIAMRDLVLEAVNSRALLSKLHAPVADERAAFARAEISFPLTVPGNRVYLAGPMTGHDNHNFPAFHAAAERLRAAGLEVVNPADHGLVDGLGWADYMRWDLVKLAGCHSVYVLPGWEKSKGASLEVFIAHALGMPVFTVEGAALASAPVADERRGWVDWTKENSGLVADFVADNWPMKKYTLAEIEERLRDMLMPPARASAPVAEEAHPVAWFIDWPDEPELGHYIAESPAANGRSRPLVFADAAPQPSEPVYAYRRKGLDDFVTCDRERFDELSAKPRLFETRIFYAGPQASDCECARRSKAVADSEAKL